MEGNQLVFVWSDCWDLGGDTHANRQSTSVRKSSLLTAALKEKCLPQVTQGWSHPAHCHHRPQQLLVEELLRKTRPEASKSQQGGLDRKKSEGDEEM